MADNYLITGYWGEPHVTAENDRGINAAMFGAGRFVLPVGEQFNAEYIGNNTIRMYDGKLMDNGAAAGIPAGNYVDLLITEAGQGMKRNDLIVFQYSQDASTLVESGTFVVVKGTETSGTASDPVLTQADLLSGEAVFDQMALWRVSVSGTTISAPVKLFTVYQNNASHAADKNNPHGVTTAQIGAISKAGGNFSGSTVTVGFVHDGGDAPVNKFVAKTGEMVCYGDKILSMYTVQADGAIYGINIMNDYLQPNGTAASKIGLGRDGRRYLNLFLVNAANVSSDRNVKTDIHGIDERFVRFFDRIEPVSYKLIGDNHDRDHLGFISQDIKAAMDEVGISDMEFGGYCRDIKLDPETDKPVLDKDGNPVYSYSLRYGEFIALNTMMIQQCRAENKALRAELEALKSKLCEK